MIHILPVMLGGAIGAGLRYFVSLLSAEKLTLAFPVGTLLVNLIGGFAMGVLYALLLRGSASEPVRLFLGVGILGGFTTFSAFSLDAALMWQRSDYAALGSYIVASVFLSIAALFIGMVTVRGLT